MATKQRKKQPRTPPETKLGVAPFADKSHAWWHEVVRKAEARAKGISVDDEGL